jgi:hypothetical protein
LANRPPKTYASRFILPWLFRPFRVPSLSPPARHLSMLRRYLPWVSSLIATSPNGIPHVGNATSPRFRPQAFSTSRRLSPPFGLLGLFHPAATYRVRPVQGLLPSCSCSPSSRERCPLVVKRTIAHQPRLAATSVRPDFEALIHTKKRCSSLGLTAPQLAPLVRFSSPPGAPPCATLCSGSPKPSTPDVTSQGLRSHDTLSRPPSAYSR